ncbi:MAG: hypothetical protein RL376_1549 [Verrucomicrobiota bacterium]
MHFLFRLLGWFLLPVCLQAASIVPQSLPDKLAAADACGLAQLITSSSYLENGRIYTRFTFRTIEAIHGAFPAYFRVTARGGTYQNFADADSRLPKLVPQQSYLLFLAIAQGKLGFADGPGGVVSPASSDLAALRAYAATLAPGADLTATYATDPVSVEYSVTASGLLEESGVRRFTLPDRGEPIPVYADVSTLPASITSQQAVTALQNALAAWEAVCTVRFSYLGTQTFAQSASAFGSSDGLVIRVQFHDNFNEISDSSSTLGFGGAGFFLSSGDGGTVAGRAFNPVSYGYVVLNHPKTSLSNATTLEEVLTHEIGHVIGLAHSSETSGETDATLAGAIMFFQAHADARGATLNAYDTATVLQAYPVNTPPYGFDRVLYAVTKPPSVSLSNPQVNRVTLGGLDLQGTAVTLQVDEQTADNGTFSVSGEEVTFTPDGWYGDATVGSLSSGYYDRLKARYSDGTNLSPFIEVRVVGFRSDTEPSGAPDGVPDSWMTTYFGSASGSSAAADPDGDGLSNLQEFLIGTNPNDAASRFQVSAFNGTSLTWTTQQFGVYRVQSSTDLSTWTDYRWATQPDASTSLTINDLPAVSAGGRLFFRVQRVD